MLFHICLLSVTFKNRFVGDYNLMQLLYQNVFLKHENRNHLKLNLTNLEST